MRVKSTPFVVDLTSNYEDPLGKVVPTPAAPEEGKIFWAVLSLTSTNKMADTSKIFFI